MITEKPNTTSMATRWYVLIVMMLVYTLSIADRYVVSTVLDDIKRDLDLTDQGVAMLSSWPLALFYVVLGFPVSYILDRRNRTKIVAVCISLWSGATILCGVASSIIGFALSRIGVGVGEAGGTPGANSILSDYFPASRRPMALTIFSLGAPIGAWLAYEFAGAVAEAYGWKSVFWVLGLPGFLVGALIWFTIREPARGQLDAEIQETAPSVKETTNFLFEQTSAVHVMIASALTALWGWGLIYFTPSFLQRIHHLNAEEAGLVTGNIHLFGGGFATLITSWLFTRRYFDDPRRMVKFMGYIVGIATVTSIGIYYTRSLDTAYWLCWIFIPAIYFYIGPCFGILNNLAMPRMRAMFCAATLFVANVGNLIIAPVYVGSLSNWFDPAGQGSAESLRLALLCLTPVGFWATFHYFWSARRIVQDQTRATGISPI
ncbi:MAG: spinster family MFS transporter [Gammaproteobacteria bacterium]